MNVCQINVSVFSYKSFLFLVGDLGIICIDISYALSKICFYCNKYSLYINAIKDNNFTSVGIKHKFLYQIKVGFNSLNELSKRKLLLFGTGFRCWVLRKQNNSRDHILLRLGFSKDICFIVPLYIKIICLRTNFFILKSYNKVKLHNFITLLQSARQLNNYKNKGISSV